MSATNALATAREEARERRALLLHYAAEWAEVLTQLDKHTAEFRAGVSQNFDELQRCLYQAGAAATAKLSDVCESAMTATVERTQELNSLLVILDDTPDEVGLATAQKMNGLIRASEQAKDGFRSLELFLNVDPALLCIKQLELTRHNQQPAADVTMVRLNVYIHSSASRFGLPVYHTGVEVGGREFSFSAHTGVVTTAPRIPPSQYTFSETIDIGPKIASGPDTEIPVSLPSLFCADSYCVVSHNCNHFSEALCTHLTGKHIPPWINQLATKASELAELAGGSSVLAAVANAALGSSRAELEAIQISSWIQDPAVTASLDGMVATVGSWLQQMLAEQQALVECPFLSQVCVEHREALGQHHELDVQLRAFCFFVLDDVFTGCCQPPSRVVTPAVLTEVAFAFGQKCMDPVHAVGVDPWAFCRWVATELLDSRTLTVVQLEHICTHLIRERQPTAAVSSGVPKTKLERTLSERCVGVKIKLCSALAGVEPIDELTWLQRADPWLTSLYNNFPVGEPLLRSELPFELATAAATRIQQFARRWLIRAKLQKLNIMSTDSTHTLAQLGGETVVQRWRSGSVLSDLELPSSPVGSPGSAGEIGESGLLRFGLRVAINQSVELTSLIDSTAAATHSELLAAINHVAEALELQKTQVLERCEQVCAEFRHEAQSQQQTVSTKAEVATVLCEEARILFDDNKPKDAVSPEGWSFVSPRDGLVRFHTREPTEASHCWDQDSLLEGLISVQQIQVSEEACPKNFGSIQDRWFLQGVDRCQAAFVLMDLQSRGNVNMQDGQHQVADFFQNSDSVSIHNLGSIVSEFMKADTPRSQSGSVSLPGELDLSGL